MSNARLATRSRSPAVAGLGVVGGGSVGSMLSHWIASGGGRWSGSSQMTAGPMTVAPACTVRPAPTQTGPMNLAVGSTVACASCQTCRGAALGARRRCESGRVQSCSRSWRKQATSRSIVARRRRCRRCCEVARSCRRDEPAQAPPAGQRVGGGLPELGDLAVGRQRDAGQVARRVVDALEADEPLGLVGDDVLAIAAVAARRAGGRTAPAA